MFSIWASCVLRQRKSFTLLSELPFKEAIAIVMLPKESCGLDPGGGAAVKGNACRWFYLRGGRGVLDKSDFFIKKHPCRLP